MIRFRNSFSSFSTSLFLASGLAAQQGGEIGGLSAISAGRSASGGAAADNVMESARNPAILAFLFGGGPRQPRSSALEVQARAFWSPVSGRDASGQPFRVDTGLAGGVWGGFATEVSEDMWLGFTVMPTAGGGAELQRETLLNVGTTTRMRTIDIDTNLLQVGVQPAFAWRPQEEFAIGVGLSLRHTRLGYGGATDINTLETFQGPSPFGRTWGELLSGDPFNVTSLQAEFDLDANDPLVGMALIGAVWTPAPETQMSMWFRSPSTSADLTGDVEVDLNPELGPILSFLGLTGNSHYDLAIRDVTFPMQLGFAMAQQAGERSRLLFDFTWTDWSKTFDGLTAELTNPDNPDFTTLIGGAGATDFDLDLTWNDIYTFAVGFEHDLETPITLRAGVGWSSDPTTGSVGPGTHPYNNWHLSAGASLWGDGGGDWHFAVSVSLPQRFLSGTNQFLSDFSFDRYRQAVYSIGIGYTLFW